MSNKHSKFLQDLISISPRRGKGENLDCKVILD